MKPKIFGSLTVLLLLWLGAGCAPKAVILAPGPVPMPTDEARFEGPWAWSVTVRDVVDARPPERAGQRVGTLYTRFETSPQAAFLEPDPTVYVKEQLSRYLLYRGLEASSPQNARLYLTVRLEQFSLDENPGKLWDALGVRVAYTVRFSDSAGRELGKVRLVGSKEVNVALGAENQAKEAFREALGETFNALTRSDVFLQVLRSTPG